MAFLDNHYLEEINSFKARCHLELLDIFEQLSLIMAYNMHNITCRHEVLFGKSQGYFAKRDAKRRN